MSPLYYRLPTPGASLAQEERAKIEATTKLLGFYEENSSIERALEKRCLLAATALPFPPALHSVERVWLSSHAFFDRRFNHAAMGQLCGSRGVHHELELLT